MRYIIPFTNVPLGATGTFITLARAISTDLAGDRFKLMRISVGPSNGTPPDLDGNIQVKRILDTTAGAAGTPGSTISAANIPKKDTQSQDAPFSAGIDYTTAEPGTYQANPVHNMGMNAHGAYIKDWEADGDDPPKFHRNESCGVLGTSRGATFNVTGEIEIESF